MSSTNFFLKPPVLITGLILIALIALSAGLQKKAETPEVRVETERTEFDLVETGRTRIATVNAPSVSSRRQSTASRAPVAARQEPRKNIVEDFETALRRADGNSYLTGRIFGRDNSEEREQQRAEGRRSREADGNTSGGRGGNDGGRRGGWGDRWGGNVPVAGAEVLLYEDDPNTTHPPLRVAVTDEEGSFTLAKLNDMDQRYIVVAKAANYAPEATYVTMSREPEQVYMRLEEGFELRGKVLDSETSQPIPGAVVYQPNSRWEAFSALGTTTSSITGEFVFPNVQRGSALTQAQADGYATTKARVRAPDTDTVIAMQSGGASISGVTIDRLTGKPHGGARVWATTARDIKNSVVSAEDGTFTLDNLPEGTFEVYAVRGMKSESQEIELARGQKITDVELILPAELIVSGQVLHATERKPLEGIKVWYQSGKGAQFRKTNADGRFTFETMAIDEYAILIHEKGFLPVQDKRSTAPEETLVRKVAKNQSSDELTIRLRPVPTVEGNVRADGRRRGGGGEPAPVNNADLTLSYMNGRDLVQLSTKSDPAGNFFFNLPKGRGEGIVVAKNEWQIDVKDVKVPRKNPVQLNLRRDFMMGRLLLSDESSLDGVTVDVARWIPRNRSESGNAKRVTLNNVSSMGGGRVFAPLPRDEDIELTFYMPDGNVISKDYKTDELLNSRPIFVYDPVSEDIVADTSPRGGDRGGPGRRGGGRGEGGRGEGNGQNRPGRGEGNAGGNNNQGQADGGNNQNSAPAPVQPASAPAQ